MISDQKPKQSNTFHFKQFDIKQDNAAMKVNTDGIMLGAWASADSPKNILDIGTGTGVIAIMLAQKHPEAEIIAVEVDEDSYHTACLNTKNCQWSSNIEVVHQSIQDYSRFAKKSFDLIVSNPPFFSGGVLSAQASRAEVRHTVKLPHGELLRSVRSLLTPTGSFQVVLPLIEGLRFQEFATHYGLYCNRVTEVFPKKDKEINRLLMKFSKQAHALTTDQLTIYKDEEYTTEYQQLTKAYYI